MPDQDQEIDLTDEIETLDAALKAERTRSLILCDPLGHPIPGIHLGTELEVEQVAKFGSTLLWLQTAVAFVLLGGMIAWTFSH